MTFFNQALGQTIQSYERKANGFNLFTKTLSEHKIKHLVLKGAAIRELYPVAPVRTSGDTDIIVDKDMLEATASVLVEKGFKHEQDAPIQQVLFYDEEEYEIKNYIDNINEKNQKYFENTFDDNKVYTENGYTYYMKPLYHLVYVTSHLLAHIKDGGAGVRQLMDIHVLISSYNIDINEYLNICDMLDFGKSAKILLTLSKQFFKTDIDINYEIEESLYDLLTDTMLNGGLFGFALADVGTKRLMKTIGQTEKNNVFTSIRAVLQMFVISPKTLYCFYPYAKRHHWLWPIAYLNRLFDAIFKRNKQNRKHIKSMFTQRETAVKLNDLVKELDL
jgi:hypothetical protein